MALFNGKDGTLYKVSKMNIGIDGTKKELSHFMVSINETLYKIKFISEANITIIAENRITPSQEDINNKNTINSNEYWPTSCTTLVINDENFSVSTMQPSNGTSSIDLKMEVGTTFSIDVIRYLDTSDATEVYLNNEQIYSGGYKGGGLGGDDPKEICIFQVDGDCSISLIIDDNYSTSSSSYGYLYSAGQQVRIQGAVSVISIPEEV